VQHKTNKVAIQITLPANILVKLVLEINKAVVSRFIKSYTS